MKTRKKITKAPIKDRRSSIICVKKSPIVRRNLYQNVRNPSKDISTTAYESPLKHLYKNSCENLPTTSNFIEVAPKKKENEEKKDENKNDKDNADIISIQTLPPSICNKKNAFNNIEADEIRYSKKKKINENSLSRINNNNKTNSFCDSVILLDDMEFQPIAKTVLCNVETNAVFSEPKKSCTNMKPLSKNEEVVVIDCNDSLMETETHHNAFDQNVNLATTTSQFTDSVIIIDPDDEPSTQSTTTIPKFNEDCFVVWSSLPQSLKSNDTQRSLLPQPFTSDNTRNTKSPRPNTHSLVNKNFKVSKCNKIIFDTQADLTNLRHLNNENNKPSKKKSIKSPKIKKTIKKPLLKTPYKTKVGVKSTIETSPRVAMKSTMKQVTKVTRKIPAKIGTKPTAATLKKRAKNNGELIFLSQSKEDNEVVAKTKTFKKGKLREIVIDGSNVAMAYTKNKKFSEKGIKMLIDYFTKKGHTVKVFVPQYRRSRNFQLLEKWHTEGIVIFTPSRKLGNKSFTPYDDRYILEYATACKGIVVSQDQFRDLYDEKPQYRDTIENRILVPTFVGDYVMFPEDPLGRDGPTLANFLKH